MATLVDAEREARQRALARIRATGRPVPASELLGPGQGPEDPGDVDAFLQMLREWKQPARGLKIAEEG